MASTWLANLESFDTFLHEPVSYKAHAGQCSQFLPMPQHIQGMALLERLYRGERNRGRDPSTRYLTRDPNRCKTWAVASFFVLDI